MIKKYSIAAAITGIALLIAGTASSSFAGQSKGDSSLQLGGSFFHGNGADVGILNLDLGYGYYLTEAWEVGILQSLGYMFIDNEDDIWSGSTVPYFNYHFLGLSENNTFQPFIGAFIGVTYNENDTTGTIGPQIGFNSFISEKTFITVKYRYEWFFDDLSVSDIDDSSSDGNHVFTLGVGFLF